MPLPARRLLAGVVIVTLDPHATALGEKIGARILTEGARDGHTGSVNAGRRILAREGRGGMITIPGDIPATRAGEIDAVLSAHLAAPSFTISPAHDDLGSNAVVCSPPESVPLRFGDNSYFPHLDAARRHGIEPTVIRQPGIAMDIDHPVDLALFLRLPQSKGTRTRALLDELGVPALLAARGIGMKHDNFRMNLIVASPVHLAPPAGRGRIASPDAIRVRGYRFHHSH